MKDYFASLPDGWTIYVWMIAAAGILIGAAFALRWALKNNQFDEDIKYVVFDEHDKDKMDPEEFKKSVEVNKQQEELRIEVIAAKEKVRAEKNANR